MCDNMCGVCMYHKSGNFRCKNIFVVDMSNENYHEIKTHVHYNARQCTCGTGSFLKHESFSFENFQIHGMWLYRPHPL